MKNISKHGNAQVIGAAALVGAVVFFSVLWTLYVGVSDVAAKSSAVREAGNIAAALDSVGSSAAYCKTTYKTPPKLSGKSYLLHVRNNRVTVSLLSPSFNASSVFYSDLTKNFSASGGVVLTIIRNTTLEVI
jgi:hypothetical protein